MPTASTQIFAASFMMSRRGSRLISAYGGVQKVAPLLAGSLMFAGLANLSLPGMSTFISEFLVLVEKQYGIALPDSLIGGRANTLTKLAAHIAGALTGK